MRYDRTLAGIIVAAVFALTTHAYASELSQVVQKGNHLIALNELGLTVDQIDEILPLSAKLTGAVRAWQLKRQRLISAAQADLESSREALTGRFQLAEAQVTALDKLEEDLEANDDELYETVVDIMLEIEEEFHPQQNAYIDWTPPRATAKASRDTLLEQAQQERVQTALILATEQQLERIRTYPLERYILEAQKVVDDFLRPLIDPMSPDYPAARQFMFKLVEQVRLMREPEWQQRRTEFAEILVGELGLLEPIEDAAQPKPYNWQGMYAIFSDLGAPNLLQSMKTARAEY